ncbi:type II secretion system F family protein [Candidatus Arthromitus sp. SFB-rat-Yit]|uniref:type II secretion system F family protein n=1 Tax=Candidatus Arthromitus sp. SFB-rat-Yit TaxID=1041504 RepID=UPI000227A211|nr:type II secretion system F family protein [Candidatus Arthromitus sp. SFB-rat-Yit]BAK81401.1 putative type II secretion system protein [Candidatus Arthromitus sp. SFB-rat-Yit]
MIGNYFVLVKEERKFKFKFYEGDFRDFLYKCKLKIYFKLKIPKIFVFKKKLKITWYKRFCEDLYFLLESGISLTEAIQIFSNNSKNNARLKSEYKFYDSLYSKLLKGNLFYDALSKMNYKLDNIFLSLISVSEETGKLSDVLNNLNKYYEDKINISNKIKSSMSYPILLFTFLIIMFNLCILVFIPSYFNSFQSQISNLPNLSRIFIDVCLFIKDNYFTFCTLMIGSITLFMTLIKNRVCFAKIIFKIPIISKIHFKKCQLKFIQMLYYIIDSGIDLATALKIIGSLGNDDCSKYANYIYGEINQGSDFCEALTNTKIFDSEVISIISVGEKSSNLALALKNIWTTYSKRHYESFERYSKLIEPIFIVICGIIVLVFISIFIIPLISYENFNSLWGG